MDTILELKNITKKYPGVLALDQMSISFKKGEVHALLGENGAGKSTLIKVLAGAIAPDGGEIYFEGKKQEHLNPARSRQLGIGVIYQEFNLVPTLSIAENIFLGSEERRGIFVDKKSMYQRAGKLLKELGIHIEPSMKVRNLSVAYQQIVEIAKAVSNDVKVLVMDEPTAPLTDTEVELLFRLVRKLVEQEVTIIFISHRMEELFEIADRVTVLRDGAFITTQPIKDVTKEELISYMVGRKMEEQYPKRVTKIGEPMLEVKHLYASDFVKDVNFMVRKGEILGIAGLVGSGRSELVRAVFGADLLQWGEVYLNGEKVKLESPRQAIEKGVVLIPENRKEQGVVLNMSIASNIILSHVKKMSKGPFLDRKKNRELAASFIEKLKIKTPGPEQKVVNLSGGNQQKVVIGKCLATGANVYFFDEPTRGIDVGAKYEIYVLMNELAAQGNAIVMISSELPEVLGMADRILVMREGRVAGEIYQEEADQKKIMKMASGN